MASEVEPGTTRRATVALVGERDVVTVSGVDAATFLQGQLSADVAGLATGDSTWSLLLEPQGKVDAWLRVWRSEPDRFLLDVDAGWGDPVLTRLRRFLMRVEVALEAVRWSWVGLRGPDAAALAAHVDGAVLVAPVDWRGVAGADVLGPELAVSDEVSVLTPEAAEALRIRCGWPAMGRELDDTVIPAEAGTWLVENSVSFTKGCYTGQELVARVDSRGSNTPRRLRGVVIEAAPAPPVGAEVVHNGEVRGTLSSVAVTDDGTVVALSLLHRSVEDGAPIDLRWAGGSAVAIVRDLPMQEPLLPVPGSSPVGPSGQGSG